MKRLLAIVALIAGVAAAIEYHVDPSGGPEALTGWVAEAFDAWEDAAVEELGVTRVEEADTVFAYGEPSQLGPDAVTVTISRSDDAGRTLTVLAHPERTDLLRRALLHETGLVIGLSPGEDGAMSPWLAPDEPAQLGDADASALHAMQDALPGDINRDGVVDFYDLILLARDFGRRGAGIAADLTGDGVVAEADLEILKEAYTFGEPSQSPPTPATLEDEADESPEVPDLPVAPDEPDAENEDENNDSREAREPLAPGEDEQPQAPETVDDAE